MAQLRTTSAQFTASAISTNPKEISVVSPPLLCILLSYPALGAGVERDLTRNHRVPCMDAIPRSYDTFYFPPVKSFTGTVHGHEMFSSSAA